MSIKTMMLYVYYMVNTQSSVGREEFSSLFVSVTYRKKLVKCFASNVLAKGCL
jgi:hypothetical protein